MGDISRVPEVPQFELDPFQQLVKDRIDELGDDNHPPADRFDFGRKTEDRSFDYIEANSGKREFGNRYLTHQLDVEEFRVVYAFRSGRVAPERSLDPFACLDSEVTDPGLDSEKNQEVRHISPGAHVDVYEFGEGNRSLKSRTMFTSADTKSMHKSRLANFGPRYRPFTSPPELVRDLSVAEAERLFKTIVDPSTTAIRGIIVVTENDQKVIEKNRKQLAEIEAEHQHALDSIRRSGGIFHPPSGNRY